MIDSQKITEAIVTYAQVHNATPLTHVARLAGVTQYANRLGQISEKNFYSYICDQCEVATREGINDSFLHYPIAVKSFPPLNHSTVYSGYRSALKALYKQIEKCDLDLPDSFLLQWYIEKGSHYAVLLIHIP